MKKIFLFTLLILFFQNNYSQSITGTVTSCVNTQLKRADIQILSNSPVLPKPIIKTISISPNGEFKIKFDGTGFYQLRFCGVDHQPLEVPFFIEYNNNIKVAVKLEPNYDDELNELRVIGDFNDFSFGKSAIKMIKEDNGDFTASITSTSDTLSYQILGMSKSKNSVNNLQADYFSLDDGGDYISVIKTKKDANVKIIVRKKDLISSKCKSTVTFDSDTTITQFVYSLLQDIDKRDIEEFKSASNNLTKQKQSLINWAIVRLTENPDSIICKQLINQFYESSPLWSIFPSIIPKIISIYSKENQLDYLKSFIEKNNDETIKPFIFLILLNTASELGKTDIVNKYYKFFSTKYSDSNYFEMVKSQYSPDRNIQIGKNIPTFSLTSIDDTTLVLTNNKIKNRIYLIDFWATWCAPCISEMKYLQKAFEKYESKGLNIISVSLDFKIDDVRKFRKEKWSLPWFNSFIKYDSNNQLIKDFELTSIPKPMLINGDGKIIATDMQLRGESLDKTLSKLFGN